MARHASSKNNYSLSGGAVALLVAIVLLLGALVWYFAGRGGPGDSDDAAAESPDCVAGDLVLPVASSDRFAGQSLIDAYAATHPVVRDFCVTPELVDDLGSAAVYIAPNTPVAHQLLSNAGRTQALADPQPVFSEKVGLVGAKQADVDGIDAGTVRYPVGEESSASAVAAATIAGNDNDAVEALTQQRIAAIGDLQESGGEFAATTQHNVPGGMTFTPLDASVLYTAIPLNQNDAVDENQARAGQDFARSAAEAFDGDTDAQPVIGGLVWAAALPAGGESITGGPDGTAAAPTTVRPSDASGQIRDTLFVLDTSDAMAPYVDAAADAIGGAAGELTEAGKVVGLWNYSSPLSPGVVKGYRVNVVFTPSADEVAGAAKRFITGGVPQTREAVLAAVSALSGSQPPTRIVVVTSGTADAGDDSSFEDQVRAAAGEDVELAVVHVGGAQVDATLNQIAAVHVEAADAGALHNAVREAAGL